MMNKNNKKVEGLLEVDEPNDTRRMGIDRDQKRKFAEIRSTGSSTHHPRAHRWWQDKEGEKENELIAVWCHIS
jgi:hypothetical protein